MLLGGMQADGEVDLAFFIGEFVDHWYKADGGNGETAFAEVEAFVIVEDVNGFHCGVVVVKRFAHAHNDYVGDSFVCFGQHSGIVDDLLNDFHRWSGGV